LYCGALPHLPPLNFSPAAEVMPNHLANTGISEDRIPQSILLCSSIFNFPQEFLSVVTVCLSFVLSSNFRAYLLVETFSLVSRLHDQPKSLNPFIPIFGAVQILPTRQESSKPSCPSKQHINLVWWLDVHQDYPWRQVASRPGNRETGRSPPPMQSPKSLSSSQHEIIKNKRFVA